MRTSCIRITWPERWAGYARPRMYRDFWHGTLLQDKADGSGLNYRRNRYYDPATSRFTQEDPIGLAGGLNLYGFAEGDPVTYGDPYGLCAFGIGRDAAFGQCTAADGFHSGALSDDKWAPSSSCRILGCWLRNARPSERNYVMRRLSTLRTDIDFCRKVTEAGLEMAARQLGMFDNDVRDWDGIPV